MATTRVMTLTARRSPLALQPLQPLHHAPRLRRLALRRYIRSQTRALPPSLLKLLRHNQPHQVLKPMFNKQQEIKLIIGLESIHEEMRRSTEVLEEMKRNTEAFKKDMKVRNERLAKSTKALEDELNDINGRGTAASKIGPIRKWNVDEEW